MTIRIEYLSGLVRILKVPKSRIDQVRLPIYQEGLASITIVEE